MSAPLKYVKLASGEEILAMYMEPEGGFFNFKHPIKISQVTDKDGEEGVRFTKWIPFKGYELKIGKKDGKQSYVVWEIKEMDNTTCTLSITVYPHLLSKYPKIISYLPFKLIIKPKLYNYLFSVISGLKYYLENNEKVPKNNFGKHKWFS